MIEIEQLTRSYGDRVAVNRLNLTVQPGEIVAFLGPNGAGKTTTIKTIVGLLLPNSGLVRVCGFDVVRQPREASRCVGYVPDQPYLYEKLSGREFLNFTTAMYGLDSQVARRAIDDVIEAFELQGFVDRLAESYSHGMRQRVVFASAMVHRPAALVVDEPMVGLDPRSMRFVKTLLRQQATGGTSIFLSTHTLSVAEEIADRIGIIHLGKLRFLGPLNTLREQMRNELNSDSSLEDLFLSLTSQSSEELRSDSSC